MLRPTSRTAKMVSVLATAHKQPASTAQTMRCGAWRRSSRTKAVPWIRAGRLQRARKTPRTIASDTTTGEAPVVASGGGGWAAPSQAPAVRPHSIPRPWRVRTRRGSINESIAGRAVRRSGPGPESRTGHRERRASWVRGLLCLRPRFLRARFGCLLLDDSLLLLPFSRLRSFPPRRPGLYRFLLFSFFRLLPSQPRVPPRLHRLDTRTVQLVVNGPPSVIIHKTPVHEHVMLVGAQFEIHPLFPELFAGTNVVEMGHVIPENDIALGGKPQGFRKRCLP